MNNKRHMNPNSAPMTMSKKIKYGNTVMGDNPYAKDTPEESLRKQRITQQNLKESEAGKNISASRNSYQPKDLFINPTEEESSNALKSVVSHTPIVGDFIGAVNPGSINRPTDTGSRVLSGVNVAKSLVDLVPFGKLSPSGKIIFSLKKSILLNQIFL